MQAFLEHVMNKYRGSKAEESKGEGKISMIKMIAKRLKPKKKIKQFARKLPLKLCNALIKYFEKHNTEILICNRPYHAASLPLEQMLEFSKNYRHQSDEGDSDSNGYWNIIQDYKTGGINPWQDIYADDSSVDEDDFAVHYDEADVDDPEGDDYQLLWVACDPDKNEICGTALCCSQDVEKAHTADNPKLMKLEDMESVPKETLVLVNLSKTAHSAPSMTRLRQFNERLFMTIPYQYITQASSSP